MENLAQIQNFATEEQLHKWSFALFKQARVIHRHVKI